MQRDHMMGWAIPAEPLGPAIRPLQSASKAQNEASLKEFAVLSFETGDHMLPGMKQSDFPKEYDTRVAIEDRALGAYEKAMREMLPYGADLGHFGYDAGAPEGDRTVFAKLTKEKCDAVSQRLMAAQREKNATLTELMLKMQAAKQRQWEGRALGRIPHWL